MSSFERRNFSDELNIDTPEQVELVYGVAGIGSRFVAILLDSLILFGIYIVAILALVLIFSGAAQFSGELGRKLGGEMDTATKWVLALFILMNFLLLWGYFALFEALWHGQTPGKRLMKLRVIKDSGRQITFFESLARNLLRFVDYLPGMYLTGVITMLCNRRNKRLGDFAAGTIVVHERAEEQPLLVQTATTSLLPSWAPTRARGMAPLGVGSQPVSAMFPADAVARLSTRDLVVIEAFFARMLDLPLETRAAMAYRIVRQMAAKMGVAVPEGNPERALESIAYQMRSTGR
jgi:uncharacterized RDD family membrane protein YckC